MGSDWTKRLLPYALLFNGLVFSLNEAADAQPQLEQFCISSLQNAKTTTFTFDEKSARTLCKGTINPLTNTSCFREMLDATGDFNRAVKECSGLATVYGYASYLSNPFIQDSTDSNNPWKWIGGDKRKIINPLDGGVLLEYSMTKQGNADGCSGGAPRERQLFHQACLAHDNNYDAPFALAGFPDPPNGQSIGKLIADSLFLSDMKLIVNNARADNDIFTNSINDQAAFFFYRAVEQGGTYRVRSRQVVSKGGLIMVENNGSFLVDIRLKWDSPRSNKRQEAIIKRGIVAPFILLSADASNIEFEVLSSELPFDANPGPDGYDIIFSRKFANAGVYTFTVGGSHKKSWVADGLHASAPKKTKYQVSIKTADEAGAGTDSNIYMRICGEKGCTAEQQINSKISGDAFERNQNDLFVFSDYSDVGIITRVELRSAMDYTGAAWKPVALVITNGAQTKSVTNDKYIDNTYTLRLDIQ
jgi:hypothetical protein